MNDSKGTSSHWQKGELLYEGKAKQVYSIVGDSEHIWLDYKDSLTAFNAQKKGAFANKGGINREIASIIFRFLAQRKVASHWTADIDGHVMICRKLQMIPLEVVVRNRVAGSFAKKFGLEEGAVIATPLVEFYYKSDKLEDPFISDDQALYLGTVKHRRELEELKTAARAINGALKEFYGRLGVDLIDFKLEFGYDSEKRLVLGDEITPDSCRLWDQKTGEKLDKDRFRRDLGRVAESYEEVLRRIRTVWEKEL
jgi:phosphoribosylaminoimidazole-succinocarboxamide synthase